MEQCSSSRTYQEQDEKDARTTALQAPSDASLRMPCYCEENVWRLAHRRLAAATAAAAAAAESKEGITTSIAHHVVFVSNPRQCCPMWHQRAAAAAVSTRPQGGSSQDKDDNDRQQNTTTTVPPCYWDYHVILLETTTTKTTARNWSTAVSRMTSNGNNAINACHSIVNDNINDKGSNGANTVRTHTTTVTTRTTTMVLDMDTLLSYPCPLQEYLKGTFQQDCEYGPYAPLFRVVDATLYPKYFCSDRSHMYNPHTHTWNAPPPHYACIQGLSGGDGGNRNNLAKYVTMSAKPNDTQAPCGRVELARHIKENRYGVTMTMAEFKTLFLR